MTTHRDWKARYMRFRGTAFRAVTASLFTSIALIAACHGDSVTGPDSGITPPDNKIDVSAFLCQAKPKSLSLTCTSADEPGLPSYVIGFDPDVKPSNILIGGQHQNVEIVSSNITNNGTTHQFAFDVTVKNLRPQPIGTINGTTTDSSLAVAFVSGPTNTGAAPGTVSVFNATGTATFTAPGQPYFKYGQMLAQNQVSASKNWILQYDAGVESFSFLLLVSASVKYPNGYIDVFSAADSVIVASTLQMQDSVRDPLGVATADQSETWTLSSSADSAKASINSSGVLTGVAPGSVTVIATQGVKTGSKTIAVKAAQVAPDAKDDAFNTQPSATLNGNLTSDNGSGADVLGNPAATLTGFGGGSLAGNTTTNAAGASVALAGGTLTVNANGSFSLANPTTTGSYTFRYRLTSGVGIDSATVTIAVRSAPAAKNDAFTMLQGATLNGDVTANNGSGADDLGFPPGGVSSFGGGSLGGTVTDHAAGTSASLGGGTLTINANGTFSLASPTTAGSYTFQYRLTNAAGTNDATVTITVQRVPDAKDDAFTTQTSATLNGNLTSDNGSGADDLGSPAATITGFGGGSLSGNTTTNAAGASVALAGGTLTVNANGTFSLVSPTTGGAYTFRYRLTNAAGIDSATVSINVNAPPTAVVDSAASNSAPGGNWHTALNTVLSSPSLTANDVLGFPAATIASFGGGTLGGTVTSNAAGTTASVSGHSLTVNSNGSFTYTPANNFTGYFTFQYRLSNAAGSSDGTVKVAVGIRPSATNSTYGTTLLGNVRINTDTAGGSGTVVTASGDQPTYNVTVNTNGVAHVHANKTFDFTPNVGYTGAASFQFTVTNGFGTSAAATVSLTVGSNVVWFVDSAAAAGGDGRSNTPFNCLVGASGCFNGSANAAGHFVYVGGGKYPGNGTLTLKNTQVLIGRGTPATFANATSLAWPVDAGAQPVTSGVAPIIAPTTGAGITLGSGNTVRGVRVNPASGAGITGSSVGTLTLNNVAINATGGAGLDLSSGTAAVTVDSLVSTNSSATGINLSTVSGTVTINGAASAITNPTGSAVAINGSNPVFSFSGTISKTNGAGTGINITGMTGGTVTFSGPSVVLSTGSSAGVNLSTSSSTLSFVDSLKVTTTSGAGVNATSGTLKIAGTHNSITSTTGTALNVSSSTIGTGGLNFRSISANGAASGIVLNNTGSTAGLTVTGSGTASTGGTIQNTTGAGISLTNTLSPSFAWMNIQSTTSHGISGSLVTNFSLTNSVINISGLAEVAGRQESNISFYQNAGTGLEKNVTGAVTITNNTLTNALHHGINITQYDGTISNLNISNNSFTSATASSGTTSGATTSHGSAISVDLIGSATTIAGATTGSINNNTIVGFPGNAGILFVMGNADPAGPSANYGASNDSIDIVGNKIHGFSSANLMNTQAINVAINGKGNAYFNIKDNGTVAEPLGNNAGHTINLSAFGTARLDVLVQNNKIVANNTVGSNGISVGVDSAANFNTTAVMNATFNNNSVSNTHGSAFLALATRKGTMNAKILNNTLGGSIGGANYAMQLRSASSTSGTGTACFDVSGNVATGTSGGGTTFPGIGLRRQSGAVTEGPNIFGLVGLSPSPSGTPTVENYVNSKNTSTSGTFGTGGTALASATTGFTSCTLSF